MNSMRSILISVTIIAAVAWSACTQTSYTDQLTDCLVKSTTSQDRITFAKWFYSGIFFHPALQSIATVSEVKIEEAKKNAAELYLTLITQTCRQQMEDALKFDGKESIKTSAKMLGRVAARELFKSPEVTAGQEKFKHFFAKIFDDEKLKQLLRETN